MRQFSFEKLQVYGVIRDYIKAIYLVSQDFPDDEKYGMTSQIRRAALSVANNLAEGSTRITGKEQGRFTEIAYGSLIETFNILIVANDLNIISTEILNEYRPRVTKIANMLSALRKSQLARQ